MRAGGVILVIGLLVVLAVVIVEGTIYYNKQRKRSKDDKNIEFR